MCDFDPTETTGPFYVVFL